MSDVDADDLPPAEPDDERFDRLDAHTMALDLVVRGLFARWAMQQPDPRESAFRMVEATSARCGHPGPPRRSEARFHELEEDELRAFLATVDRRIGVGQEVRDESRVDGGAARCGRLRRSTGCASDCGHCPQ